MTQPAVSRLVELNNSIRDRLEDVELFVELNDDESLYEELKHIIFEKHQQGMSYQQIAFNQPYAVAYLMVLHGIFHYDEGNYWQGLLDLDQNQRTSWGNAFRQVLEEKELPTFDELAAQGLTIVTPVLMHGGIPRSCLNDYFGSFLQRYLRMGQRRNLSVRDFREIWLEQELQQVAKPVKRFISEGGAFALAWIKQSVEMAHQANVFKRRYPTREQLDDRVIRTSNMPIGVTQAYWDFVRRTRGGEQGEVLVSPLIQLFGQELRIDLPSQTLDLAHGSDISWRIERSGQTDIVRTFIEYRGRYVETNSEVYFGLYIEDLFGLKITLVQGTRVVRQWQYAQPGFVFRQHQNGETLYNRWQTLPNTAVVLATPHPVQIDGVVASPMYDDSNVALYAVDVPNVQSVSVGDVAYQIHENEDDLLPLLQGDQQLPFLQPIGAMAVYSQLPKVIIPLSRNSQPDEQKATWRIQIIDITDSGAQTHVYSKMSITHDRVVSAVSIEEGKIHIALHRLIPAHTPGAYRIELYGKRGRTPLSFVYVPNLQVVTANYIQHPSINRGAAPQIVTLRNIPDGWKAINPKLAQDANAMRSADEIIVEFDPMHEIGELVLDHGAGRKLTIELIFPRLEVHLLQRDGRLIARDTSLLKDMNWYLENKPVIEVVMMPPSAPMSAQLSIESSVYLDHGDAAQQIVVKFDSSRRWFRIDTDAAYDTIQHAIGANAQIALHIKDGERASNISMLTIQRLVSLQDASVQLAEMEMGYRMSFVWSAPNAPSNWRVVAWSLSKPWNAPVYFAVPSDTLRFQQIITRNVLVAGDTYLVGIMSVIKETDQPPMLPPDGQGLLTMRVPGIDKATQPSEMVSQLFGDASQNMRYMEQIAHYLNQYDNRDITVQVLERSLLRIHQVLMQAQRNNLLDAYWQEFDDSIRPGMANLCTHHKAEALVAMMRVLNRVQVLSSYSVFVYERIILSVSRKLFDVLVKYEIRGALVESHVVAYLGSLSANRQTFFREYGVSVEEGIDGVFVEIGDTDGQHWHGISQHLVSNEWRGVFQAYQPIQYEDALIATGVTVVRQSPFDEVKKAKDGVISTAREALFPSVMIWVLSLAIQRRRDLRGAGALSGWWFHRQMRVYELLNNYRVDRGGLREYIEIGMFRN